MIIRKLAAIDIGSNAVRLLVNNVIEHEDKPPAFKKSSLIRVPVRLGEDAFTKGEISEYSVERLIKTMKSFDLLMQIYGVEKYMATATSALREAKNGKAVVEKVFQESGIQIEIIDGKKEAEIIASTDLKELIKKDRAYLYVDVGGGSTEFTIFSNGNLKVSKSFKMGTVRILNGLVKDEVWDTVQDWIKAQLKDEAKVEIIGSGGNINKLHKMSGRKDGPTIILYLAQCPISFSE